MRDHFTTSIPTPFPPADGIPSAIAFLVAPIVSSVPVVSSVVVFPPVSSRFVFRPSGVALIVVIDSSIATSVLAAAAALVFIVATFHVLAAVPVLVVATFHVLAAATLVIVVSSFHAPVMVMMIF